MTKKAAKKSATVNEFDQSPQPTFAAVQDAVGTQHPTQDCEPKPWDWRRPQRLTPGQAALLLGFYVQLPAYSYALGPLVALSDGLPVSKVMLLDNCLSRLGHHDTEKFYCESDLGKFSTANKIATALYFREIYKLQFIIASFWSGRSELRDWYLAGKSVGAMVNLVVMPKPTRQTETEWKSNLENQIDAMGAAIRMAAGWRFDSNTTSSLCESFVRLSKGWPTEKQGDDLQIWLMGRVETLATRITDAPSQIASLEEQLKEERDRFVYEQMTINRLYGKDLLNAVNEERDRRAWPHIRKIDDLRAIAEKYARDNGAPRPPKRAGGRKPDSEE